MKFACLVYHEQSDTLPSEADLAAIAAECRDANAWRGDLQKRGHHVLTAGLQSIRTARTVRNRSGRLSISDGPFAETKECLGGFTIIDAKDFDEALELVSKFPARLTSVEVRPLIEADARMTDPVDQKISTVVRRDSHLRQGED
jgi:hypothetical protein